MQQKKETAKLSALPDGGESGREIQVVYGFFSGAAGLQMGSARLTTRPQSLFTSSVLVVMARSTSKLI